jgi:hypothetical protein
MKLSALASRGSRRDFVDLYAAAQRYGLPQILEFFQRKFALANYSVIHVQKSLVYSVAAEKEPMPAASYAVVGRSESVLSSRSAQPPPFGESTKLHKARSLSIDQFTEVLQELFLWCGDG